MPTTRIRPAGVNDIESIARIQSASPEASQWDPASYLEHSCVVVVDIVQDAGEVVLGFLVSRGLLPRQITPGEREILNLAIDPAARRQGLAQTLLKDHLSRWPGIWFLEVRESNIAAIRLYKLAGFQPVGRREGYYHDPPDTGIVMKFDS